LAISTISLVSFRNHQNKELAFCRGLTVIWGENGSGKTAILEGVHILSLGKSFRTHKQKSLIKDGDDSFIVRGEFLLKNTLNQIATELKKDGKQKIKINGDSIIARKDLVGKNNVVVLSPEEQSITKGGPAERRRFFDKVFSVVSKEYIDVLQVYSRVLKQRNAAIGVEKNNGGNLSGFRYWNEQLANHGAKLWSLRAVFLNDFKYNLSSVLNRYDSNIKLDLLMREKEITKEQYLKKLLEIEKTDLKMGRTTIGPHRDRVELIWNNKSLRLFGSQGEHKVSLVFLKLAEMCFIKDKTKSNPILLLDDLFAKLDLERSKKLVQLLHALEEDSGETVQTIATTTDIIDIENSGMFSAKKEVLTYQLER